MKYTKKFKVQGTQARTLGAGDIGTHDSGWTITGEIHEDWYEWVNDFEATHPTLGKVWGNFEDEVHATSKKAYNHFMENHPPYDWDYWDI